MAMRDVRDRDGKSLKDINIAKTKGVTVECWRKAKKLNKAKSQLTLCNTCSRATAIHCPFFATSDLEVGLRAAGVKPDGVIIGYATPTSGNKPIKKYRVVDCPNYKKGPPPPLLRRLRAYGG